MSLSRSVTIDFLDFTCLRNNCIYEFMVSKSSRDHRHSERVEYIRHSFVHMPREVGEQEVLLNILSVGKIVSVRYETYKAFFGCDLK